MCSSDLRRHLVDLEPRREIRPQVDVHAPEPHAIALLAREVRQEALHPPRGAGPFGVKEDEQGPGVVCHRGSFFPARR